MVEAILVPRHETSDCSAAVLALLQRLLVPLHEPGRGLTQVFEDLATAFQCNAAGLAWGHDGLPFLCHPQGAPDIRFPWQDQPALLTELRSSCLPLAVRTAERHWLLSLVGERSTPCLLLWLEAPSSRQWTEAEQSALLLTSQVLTNRLAPTEGEMPRWREQLRRLSAQHTLEQTALVVRRLAHDFSNVLTSILGFSELGLCQGGRDATLQRYLQEIYRGAELGAHFTDRLRLFARRIAKTAIVPISLRDVVQEEMARCAPTWPSSISLQADVPADLPLVAGSAAALNDILAALLENAREAIPSQGSVWITARRRDLDTGDCLEFLGTPAPGAYVEVSVHDSGPGFTPELLRRLFQEPFFTTKIRHRGLGLHVVYGLVLSHGGGLALNNHVEGGALARFVLPVVTAEHTTPEDPSRSPGSTRRILLVTQTPELRSAIARILQPEGYEIVRTPTAAEGLLSWTTARTQPFSLLMVEESILCGKNREILRSWLQRENKVSLVCLGGENPRGASLLPFLSCPYTFVPLPLLPEVLLDAVRVALDRPVAASA